MGHFALTHQTAVEIIASPQTQGRKFAEEAENGLISCTEFIRIRPDNGDNRCANTVELAQHFLYAL